jgi:ferredoxin
MPEFFLNGMAVSAMPGESVLAASQRAGSPLATVCKGRGICGACRVSVEAGSEFLEPPSAHETRLLTYLARGEDAPAHRLACQILMTDALSGLNLTALPIIRKSQQETAT